MFSKLLSILFVKATVEGKLTDFLVKTQVRKNKKLHGTYNVILRIARNLLETRENIKIESHPFYYIICD